MGLVGFDCMLMRRNRILISITSKSRSIFTRSRVSESGKSEISRDHDRVRSLEVCLDAHVRIARFEHDVDVR